MIAVSQALVGDLPTLTAWSQREGVAPTEGPVFVARDAGAVVGFLAAAVVDGVGVVIQAASPDDVQAALLVALRDTYPLRRLIVLTGNDRLCNELRSAGARHVATDACVLVGDFNG